MFYNLFQSNILILSIFTLIVLFLFLILLRGQKVSSKVLVYSSLCVAIAFVLSNIKIFSMPQGGSVSAFSMFFITILGYFFGIRIGVLAGATLGLLNLIFFPFIVHPLQPLLDYIFAFSALGLSGLFMNNKHALYIGYIFGVLGRLFFHIISGILFFYMYVGDMNVILYSVIYNTSFILPEAIITIFLISIPSVRKAIKKVKIQVQN